MENELRRYLFPTEGIAWSRGVGQPAGVYLVGERVHVAAYGSHAERDLVERGATHIAVLRFDADLLECAHARPIVRIDAAEAIASAPPDAAGPSLRP